jgi:hypothetical protein
VTSNTVADTHTTVMVGLVPTTQPSTISNGDVLFRHRKTSTLELAARWVLGTSARMTFKRGGGEQILRFFLAHNESSFRQLYESLLPRIAKTRKRRGLPLVAAADLCRAADRRSLKPLKLLKLLKIRHSNRL